MKNLGYCFKYLQRLNNLQLDLQGNKLGKNKENFRLLGNGFRHLNKLERLELVLYDNKLGENEWDLK